MKIQSLVDPKKRELVREAIRRKDASLLLKEKPKTETIRGSGLEVYFPGKPGLTMEEALAKAKAEKRVITSNIRLDRILNGTDGDLEIIKDVFPCWTGTMTAYEEPGKPFGDVVEFVDETTKLKYLFPVPQKFKGMKDCVLLAEHPGYRLEIHGSERSLRFERAMTRTETVENERILRLSTVRLIERFPSEANKWYLTDPNFGIPCGDPVNASDPNARYLLRTEKRVGLSARGYDRIGDYGGRVVGFGDQPSTAFGVAVESRVSGPESSNAKKTK